MFLRVVIYAFSIRFLGFLGFGLNLLFENLGPLFVTPLRLTFARAATLCLSVAHAHSHGRLVASASVWSSFLRRGATTGVANGANHGPQTDEGNHGADDERPRASC